MKLDFFKKILKDNFIGIFLFIILISLFFKSYKLGYYFGFIDFGFSFFDIEQSIYNNLFVWGEKRSFGENHFNFLFDIFEYIIYYIFIFLGISKSFTPGLLQLITIISIPVLFFFNLRLFSRIGIGKKMSNNIYWILSFLPIFSLGFFNEQWHILFSQRYAWIISLLIMYFLNTYIFFKKGKIGLSITAFLSIFAFNLFPFFLAFHFFIFIYILFLYFNKYITIKRIILLYGLYILITFVAWFNILYLYTSIDFSSSDAIKYGEDLKYYVSSNNHLDNLFRGIFHLIWGSKLGWDSSMNTFNYQDYFLNPLYIIISFAGSILFFLLLSSTKVENKVKSFLYLFITFFIISIFIAKGNQAPLGNFYISVLDSINILNIYRSPANKFMPAFYTFFVFSFYILLSYSSYKKQITYILFICYIIFSIPIFITGFYSYYSFFKLPSEYVLLKKELNNYNGRVLFLPERDYGKKYNFGGYVNSINFFLYKNPTFDIGQTLLSNNNVGLSKKLLNEVNFFNDSSFNPSDIYQRGKVIEDFTEIDMKKIHKILNESKIDIIVMDYNIIGTFNENTITKEELKYYEYVLDRLKESFSKKEIGNLHVYIRKNKLFGKNIFNGDFILNVEYKNPVMYKVDFRNLKDSTITMYASYDSGWKWYINNTNVHFTKSLFDSFHERYNEYTNGWKIEIVEIKKHIKKYYNEELNREGYPKYLENGKKDYKYYIENPDGSIDVKLTLYFKPQSYFYLGLLISFTTFLFLLSYLLFDFYRNRKNY